MNLSTLFTRRSLSLQSCRSAVYFPRPLIICPSLNQWPVLEYHSSSRSLHFSAISMEQLDENLLKPIIGLENSFYIPNFITVQEEEYIIRKIQESAQPQWKELANRRLQIWGGDMTAKGILVPQPLPSFINKFPDVISRIKATGVFDSSPHKGPNHVIMNEYLPGQGIMPHEDGPRYYPVVATLSLGSHAVFHYYQYEREDAVCDDMAAARGNGKAIDMTPISSVLLEPRSLIISSGTIYTSHLHGIEGIHEDIISSHMLSGTSISNLSLLEDDHLKQCIIEGVPLKRGTRYSLTCRDVLRVSSKFNINPLR